MNKWLHQHVFSYKKPKGVPHNLKSEEQLVFIEYYNNVVKPKYAPVLFMDAFHLTQSTISYAWIRKGQGKVIETTCSRMRVNLIGALFIDDISAPVIGTYDTIGSEITVRFFWKLNKEHDPLENTVHIALDGAAYHRLERVINTAKILNVEFHYLIPYSPITFTSPKAASTPAM